MKFFIQYLSIFLPACFTLSVAEAGPIIVGGGGASEYSFVFTQTKLKDLLTECENVTCSLNADQKILIKDLIVVSTQKISLVFQTQKEMGETLYRLDEKKNLLWINKDQLWLDKDHTVSYQISDALALWVEVLSARFSWDVTQLHQLQTEIKRAYQNNIERVTTEFSSGNTFELLVWKRNGFDTLFVRDPSLQNIELSQMIRDRVQCSSFRIYSPAWASASPVDDSDPVRRVYFQMSFGYKTECAPQVGFGTGHILFSAELNRNSVYEINLKSIDINLLN